MFRIQGLIFAATVLATSAYGQDWRPVQMLPVRYPCLALAVGLQGRVEFSFTASNLGTPRDIIVVRGHPLLAEQAAVHLKSLTLRLAGRKRGSVRRSAIYLFQLDPTVKTAGDLVPTQFRMPNTIIVKCGYVKPSSPCEVRPFGR